MQINETFKNLIALTKRRGFIYKTSEIYGGLSNAYDYGPLGTALLRNIKNLWWNKFITQRRDMLGIDSQIILHPQTWITSGHVGSFNDVVVEDIVTNKRYRADHLIEDYIKNKPELAGLSTENMSINELDSFIKKHNIKSPDSNDVSSCIQFDLLMDTHLGTLLGKKDKVYLRGETAQGIFSNFKNIIDSTRTKLPFGVGQIGKSFRNEITLGQFIFRTFEFEQAEIEYFFNPKKSDWRDLFSDWQKNMWSFLVSDLGINEAKLRWRKHTDKERSHYSLETYDLDYEFPFGYKEVWGVAYRTDYDLKAHMDASKVDLRYTDPHSNEKFLPHVIEPAVGLNRLLFMVLVDSYYKDNDREYLKLEPKLAPYNVAVFPLVSNKEDIIRKADAVFNLLNNNFSVYFDDRGNIGKRYRFQDEIGTPYCVTIDYETISLDTVTIRERDTMKQERIHINKLSEYFKKKLSIN